MPTAKPDGPQANHTDQNIHITTAPKNRYGLVVKVTDSYPADLNLIPAKIHVCRWWHK